MQLVLLQESEEFASQSPKAKMTLFAVCSAALRMTAFELCEGQGVWHYISGVCWFPSNPAAIALINKEQISPC